MFIYSKLFEFPGNNQTDKEKNEKHRRTVNASWNAPNMVCKWQSTRKYPHDKAGLYFCQFAHFTGCIPNFLSTVWTSRWHKQNQINYISGQIIIFPQPRFPWNKEISLTIHHHLGWNRSCEGPAIIWPDIYIYIYILQNIYNLKILVLLLVIPFIHLERPKI